MTLGRLVKVGGLLGVAIGVGIAVTLGVALLGHEVLVLAVGEAGIPAIDDTPAMRALVAMAYAAGLAAGLAVVVGGWRRGSRRRR